MEVHIFGKAFQWDVETKKSSVPKDGTRMVNWDSGTVAMNVSPRKLGGLQCSQ